MNDNKTSKNSIVAKFAVPISFLILFFLAANFTDCDLVTFWKRRNHLTDLVVVMMPPDFSYIQKILLRYLAPFLPLYSRLLALQT